MNKLIALFSVTFAAGLVLLPAQAAFVRTETALTTGVTRVTLVDESKPQRVWMVKANMNTPGLRFDYHLSQNKSYSSNTTVPAQAQQIADEGVRSPIGGINGDFFGYGQSAPQRLAVFDGRYIQTGYDASIDSWSGSRFYESPDGTFHWGEVRYYGSVTLGGTTHTIQRMNAKRDGVTYSSGVAFFTYEYRQGVPADGILVEFTEPLTAGGNAAVSDKAFTVVGTIASGTTLSSSKPNRAAIVGFGTSAAAVSAATGSGTVSWGFKIGNDSVNVRNLVGVWLTILNNGSIVPSSDQNENKDYPRTCLGYNPETNLMILLAADGRQDGWSKRISSAEVAQILKDEGCTYGAQFDGGGSTTIWDCKDGLLNKPSDGSARVVATSLFITMDPTKDETQPSGEDEGEGGGQGQGEGEGEDEGEGEGEGGVSFGKFSKYVEFTLAGYAGTETLTNFPALVRLSEESVADFKYSEIVKEHIRFADANGNMIPHEIDTWNASGESLVWVGVPALKGKTTKVRMYYGLTGTATNTTESVWSAADYGSVWHLNIASGATKDSVANYAGTVFNANANCGAGTGILGCGYTCSENGTHHSVHTGTDGYTPSDPGTASYCAWARQTGKSDDNFGVIWNTKGGSTTLTRPGFECGVDTTAFTVRDNNKSKRETLSDTFFDADWHYIVVTYDGSKRRVYLDGAICDNFTEDATITAARTDSNSIVRMGNRADAASNTIWLGDLDEMRFRAEYCSGDWVKAEYDNVTKTTFVTNGGVKPVEVAGPLLILISKYVR